MDRFEFEVPGEPTAKARPRFFNNHAITPTKTKNYETLVKELYYYKRGPNYGEKDIIIKITAYFGIPKSKSKKQQALMEAGEIRPHKKPDIDNICKIICDSLNGIAYKDDSQIIEANVEKYYSQEPKVIVLIEGV